MAYFGPAKDARQYFIDMGYEPANRQTTPDFLVSVTDPGGRSERKFYEEDEEGESQEEKGTGKFEKESERKESSSVTDVASSLSRRRQSRLPIPRTALEFAEYYKKSKVREQNILDMQDYKENFVGKYELEEKYKESSRAEHARHTRKKVHRLFLLSFHSEFSLLRDTLIFPNRARISFRSRCKSEL